MFIVTHNGYGVEYFESAEEVEAFIAKTLEPHKNLSPKEIYRGYAADNHADGKPYGDGKIKSVIIWQYRTLYTEVFMIEQR